MQNRYSSIPYETRCRYLPRGKARIWEIDFIRGICVILMILDHLALLISEYFARSWYGYDYYIFNMGDDFSRFCHVWIHSGTTRPIIHNIVLLFFFAISGISCTLSRSNTRRGTGLASIALVYSFCSLFADRVMDITNTTTVFGVLHFLAVCILLYALISWACRRDPYHIAIVAVGIIGIVFILYFCYVPPETTPKIFAIVFPPTDVIHTDRVFSTFYRQADFSPGDLFPLIPYSAYFFCGVAIAPLLYGSRRSLLPGFDGKWNKPVCFVGRHALIVYIVHLIALAGILALISFLFITPGDFGI